MESALFRDFFSCKVKNIIFVWRGACEVCLKRTSENSELRKTQISFLGGGGALVGVAGCGGHAR